MAQVDSEDSIAMPARPAGAINRSGLAKQQRDREKALRRVAKLRKRAADEIDRLLAFLDACDPYVTTELEAAIDDGPCDTDELEMGWTGVTAGSACRSEDIDEGEADYGGLEADDEASLGSVEGPDRGAQLRWAQGAGGDREESCDDEGVAI
jgi:hypothetical protein